MIDNKIITDLVGIPWKEDGRDCNGTDCLGLMELYCRARGIEARAPKIEEASGWSKEFISREIIEKNEVIAAGHIKAGDMLIFNVDGEMHIALYLGYLRMLHARRDQKSKVSRFTKEWQEYFLFAIRPRDNRIYIPPAGPPAAIAAGLMIADAIISVGFLGAQISLFTIGLLIGTGVIGYSIGLAIQAQNQQKNAASPRSKFGELQTTGTNQVPWPMIYGEIRWAGNYIYQNPPAGGTAVDVLIAIGEGPIEEVSDIRLNGEPIANFPGCSYHIFLGTEDQDVEATTGLDLDGVKYKNKALLHLYLKTSDKLRGRPNVTFKVKGRKVFTWTGSDWSTERVYSDNPAACVRDYLLWPRSRGGVGLKSSYISDIDFGEAYDDCDYLVDDGEGGTQKRYTMAYVIDQRRQAADNLAEMLIGFAATIFRSSSQYKLIVAKDRAAVTEFDDDDIEDYKIIQRSLDEKINRLEVEFIDPEQNDVFIRMPGPQDRRDQHNRGLKPLDFTIRSIGRKSQALRLATQMYYERKLSSWALSIVTGLNCVENEIGDVVKVTLGFMNWTEKLFQVIQMEEFDRNRHQLMLQEFNPDIYTDRYGAGIEVFDCGTPANPYAPVTEVSDIQLSESNYYLHRDGTVSSDILVSWDAPTDDSERFLSHYQIDIKKGSEEYKSAGTTVETSFKIPGLQEATYTIRIRTVSVNSIVSDGQESSPITLLGKQQKPGTPTGFNVYQHGGALRFDVDLHPDADFAYFRIKRLQGDWATGEPIIERADLSNYEYPVDKIGAQIFAIKAVDRSEQESDNPAYDEIVVTQPPDMNFTNDFDPWSVSLEYKLSNLESLMRNDYNRGYVRPVLALRTQTTWEEREAESQTWEYQEANNGLILDRPVESSGFFEMVQPLDLGTIFTFKVIADLDYHNVAGGSITLQMSYSEDGISYSSFANIDANAVYRARYVLLKYILATSDTNHNVYFYGGTIFIVAPITRRDWLRDIAIPSDGKTITFDVGFSYAPKVNVTIVNGVVGFIETKDKTKDGVFVRIFQDQAKTTPLSGGEVDVDALGY